MVVWWACAAVFEHRLLVAKTSEQAEVGRVSRAWIGSHYVSTIKQAVPMARQSERARDRVQNRSPQLDASPSSQLDFLLLTPLNRSLAGMRATETWTQFMLPTVSARSAATARPLLRAGSSYDLLALVTTDHPPLDPHASSSARLLPAATFDSPFPHAQSRDTLITAISPRAHPPSPPSPARYDSLRATLQSRRDTATKHAEFIFGLDSPSDPLFCRVTCPPSVVLALLTRGEAPILRRATSSKWSHTLLYPL